MTVNLHTIDLRSGRRPGFVTVTLTTQDGRKLDFDLQDRDAAAFGRSLSSHAGVPRRRKRAA